MSVSTCHCRHMKPTAAAPLSPRRERLVIAALLSGLLLAMLDQTIVGTALPRIVQELGGSSLYLWVVTAYLLPATVSLPIYARLSDRHGRRALLLIGMVVFLTGSALSASAQDMHQLIAWRALQGLGGGRARGPVVHPRRGPLHRAPERGAAGRARGPHGVQLHRK